MSARRRPNAASLRTAGLIVAAFFSLTLAVAYAQERGVGSGMTVGGWLVGLALVAALPWRRRHPVALTAVSSVVVLALPIDGLLPLIGLYVLTVCVPLEIAATLGTLLVAPAVGLSIWRDSAGHAADAHGDHASSLWRLGQNPTGEHFPWWLVLLLTATLVVGAFVLGMLSRSRNALHHKESEVTEMTVKVDQLDAEVARQRERERIAQEVHDVLGHRLSIVSVHAGALEVAAQADPALAEHARQVRESAQGSMGDLRSLLAVLRNPGSPDGRNRVLTLRDLPQLVEESVTAGARIVSSIYVDESAPLDELLSHSAYRITQELLTNARKHAPGADVRLTVRGTPADGIRIETANPATGFTPGQPLRAGNGMTGLHERARQCGGEAWAWIDDSGRFCTSIQLPWRMPNGQGVR